MHLQLLWSDCTCFLMLYWLTWLWRSLKFSLSFYKLLCLDHTLFRIFSSDKDSTNNLHNFFVLLKPSVSGENSIKPGLCAPLRYRTTVHVIDCLFTLRWILKVLYISTYIAFDFRVVEQVRSGYGIFIGLCYIWWLELQVDWSTQVYVAILLKDLGHFWLG